MTRAQPKTDYLPDRASTKYIEQQFAELDAAEALQANPATSKTGDMVAAATDIPPSESDQTSVDGKRKRVRDRSWSRRKRTKTPSLAEASFQAPSVSGNVAFTDQQDAETISDDVAMASAVDAAPTQQEIEDVFEDAPAILTSATGFVQQTVKESSGEDPDTITPETMLDESPSTGETSMVELGAEAVSTTHALPIPEVPGHEPDAFVDAVNTPVSETSNASIEKLSKSNSANTDNTIVRNEQKNIAAEDGGSSPLSLPPHSLHLDDMEFDGDNIIVTPKAHLRMTANEGGGSEDDSATVLTPPESEHSHDAVHDVQPLTPCHSGTPQQNLEERTANVVADPDTPEAQADVDMENAQLPTPPASAQTVPKDVLPPMESKRVRPPRKRFDGLVDTTEAVEGDSSGEEHPDEALDAVDLPEDAQVYGEAGEDQDEKKPSAKPKRAYTRRVTTKAAVDKVTSARVLKPKTKPAVAKEASATLTAKTTAASKIKTPTTAKAKATSGAAKSSSKIRIIQQNKGKKQLLVSLPRPSWLLVDVKRIPRFDEKLALSQQLMKREEVPDKPLPQGKPHVWAGTRQALCETLPYFKKPQGGCYQNDGHVYGFLFDGVGHCREYIDSNVIICRAGGGMEADGKTGMTQGRDQRFKEAQVQAMLNDIKHQNPVVVICGNRNKAAKVKMPHQYCVLGWYKPVMVWSEKTFGKGGKEYTTVKYRLERLNRHKLAWHAPTGEAVITDEDKEVAGPLYHQACPGCKKVFPQVYLRHWVCLNADCSAFWKLNGLAKASLPTGAEHLEYNPAFLLHDSGSWATGHAADEPEPIDLRPPIPDVDSYTLGDNLSYINTRGMCCDQCGRCTSRRFFRGWVCENPACDREVLPQHQIVKPEMMHTPWDNAPTLLRNAAPALLKSEDENPGIELKVSYKFGYKIATYRFHGMGIDGSFVHAAPTKSILKQPKEADEMFTSLQTEDMGLERRVFAVQKMGGKVNGGGTNDDKSEILPPAEEVEGDNISDAAGGTRAKHEFAPGDLMTAFSINYGMPYKFVATGASKPFADAPEAVRHCRRMLNWAQRHLLETSATEYQDFNEELLFVYLQGQKIEYHDDGEEGLGPRIASLSLGGRAKMSLRLKMKHFVGCSKTGIFTEDEPVRGGIGGAEMDEKRHAAWEELQSLKHADDKTGYKVLRTELPKRLHLVDKRMKKADELVTVSLSHGDIMVMDGYDVQKYLEHKVVPEGCLRFAMTCRTVLGNHLKPDEKPDYDVPADEVEYHGPAL